MPPFSFAQAALFLATLAAPATAPFSYAEAPSWAGKCAAGRAQSPIDVPGRAAIAGEAFHLHLRAKAAAAPQLTFADGSTVFAGGLVGGLAPAGADVTADKDLDIDVALRVPAEHSVEGKKFAAELQVRLHRDGNLFKSISLLLEQSAADGGAGDALLDLLFPASQRDALPAADGDVADIPASAAEAAADALVAALSAARGFAELNRQGFAALVQTTASTGAPAAGPTYLMYSGSNSAPPCAEGVAWLVGIAPPTHGVSVGVLGELRSGAAGNARPTQALHGRNVVGMNLQVSSGGAREAPEFSSTAATMAKDALTIAKAAGDAAENLQWRLRASAKARKQVLEP